MARRAFGSVLVVLLMVVAGAHLLAARAAAGPLLLFDAADGKVLYAADPDKLWYPASLTKIMTAYLVFEALKQGDLTLQSKLVSSENSAAAQPSKIGIPVGGEISLELGLRALIVKSANDAAVMLAEAVAGSEPAFIERMNRTAARLGMTRTHFQNPNGLPVIGQVSTARDLARLVATVIREYPEHAHYWATPYMHIGRRRLRSYNALLRTFEGADGFKTGFICDSGFNIVASATRDNQQMVAVVLGAHSAQDRTFLASQLLEHAFLTHRWKRHFNPPTIESLPPSTVSTDVQSVRSEVRGFSCGQRSAARRRARAKRRTASRRANLRRTATAKTKTTAASVKVTVPAGRASTAAKPQ